MFQKRRCFLQRKAVTLVAVFCCMLVTIPYLALKYNTRLGSNNGFLPQYDPTNTRMHFLLPANKPDVNLCKTILGGTLLDYSPPTILGWDSKFNVPNQMAGGSHLAKISGVLDYLTKLSSENDNDLVLMTDASDVWLQFPAYTLITRYNRLLGESNEVLQSRLGAARKNHLQQSVLFASGKRCAPNQLHTVACYAVPEPPTRSDLYGADTDTVIGRNKYYSHRQKYLNSGYILGPVAAMRKLFHHAWNMVENAAEDDPTDSGDGGSFSLYHGSDQSIFNKIFGEQEYMREVLRRESYSWDMRLFSIFSSRKQQRSNIEGVEFDDILHPSFVHEEFIPPPNDEDGKLSKEFGIFLDYSSDIGHQTVNSEADARWLNYSQSPLEAQIQGRNRFDCKLSLPAGIPADVVKSGPPLHHTKHEAYVGLAPLTWTDALLYSHLCFGTLPVLIHHNGDKSRREADWRKVWYQSRGKDLLSVKKRLHLSELATDRLSDASSSPSATHAVDAWINSTHFLSWEDLCPSEWDGLIFD